MSNNPSFVLRGIEDVVYEERPVPTGKIGFCHCDASSLIYVPIHIQSTVGDNEVLVEVKKTGMLSRLPYILIKFDTTPRNMRLGCAFDHLCAAAN
jgi:hypothetical protein